MIFLPENQGGETMAKLLEFSFVLFCFLIYWQIMYSCDSHEKDISRYLVKNTLFVSVPLNCNKLLVTSYLSSREFYLYMEAKIDIYCFPPFLQIL